MRTPVVSILGANLGFIDTPDELYARIGVAQPTAQLRWRSGVLEQLWRGEIGTLWYPVPDAADDHAFRPRSRRSVG